MCEYSIYMRCCIFTVDRSSAVLLFFVMIILLASFPGNTSALEENLSLAQLELVRKEIQFARESIWNRWDVSQFPRFLDTMHIPTR